jgi:hypothetical protein
MEGLFQRFIREEQYLCDVSPATVEGYKCVVAEEGAPGGVNVKSKARRHGR